MKCHLRIILGQWIAANRLGLLLAGGLWLGALSVHAQVEAAAKQAFEVAARAFQDGVYDRAEIEFAAFATNFPHSLRVPEAILFQARAALKQRKLSTTLNLLSTHAAQAGAFADQYRYWQAETHMQTGDYKAAAEAFALLARDFVDSVLLLEASYGEALARFKLGDYARVIQLLQQPEGAFQKAAKVRANDELVARGNLLLGEALLQSRKYPAAEQAAQRLDPKTLIPEFKWRQQYLLCRIQLADKRLRVALANTTNLLALAVAAGQPQLVAESVALQADLLQRLNQLDAAAEVFARNLDASAPTRFRRQALVRIIELSLAQGKLAEAAARLREFLKQNPQEAGSDLALLTLGEVHLKLWTAGAVTNLPPAGTNRLQKITNHLQAAQAQFDQLIQTRTNSPFLGKAYLNRGWCLWLQNRIAESLPAFTAATEKLAPSEDLAVARFKLADGQFQLNQLTNALRNYRAVLNDFDAFPRVREALFDHALYQMLRINLRLNNVAEAEAAMRKILEWFPESFYRDRSMLLVGQGLAHDSHPAAARALFADLIQRLPDSPLIPEIELAISRTYLEERNWTGAVNQYGKWIGRFATNALRPRAEFNRAWAAYQAGQDTNALTLFTNFVAAYPKHPWAPRAQFWVASFYYDARDFVNAERNFQHPLLLQDTNYTYQARMMAGRAAFARQSWKDAYDYFSALVSDPNCPPELVAEGLFALGDTIIQQEADPAKPLQKFDVAREVFSKIPQLYPTNRLVPQALGRIGDCYFQIGAVDAQQYGNATNVLHQVLALPNADVRTRSQAEVGLALALERMAQSRNDPEKASLLKAAFDHYYNIVIEKNLRPDETADPFWFKEAALHASRLAEETGRYETAINIYQRLAAALPHLRPTLDKKIEHIRKQSGPQKS